MLVFVFKIYGFWLLFLTNLYSYTGIFEYLKEKYLLNSLEELKINIQRMVKAMINFDIITKDDIEHNPNRFK